MVLCSQHLDICNWAQISQQLNLSLRKHEDASFHSLMYVLFVVQMQLDSCHTHSPKNEITESNLANDSVFVPVVVYLNTHSSYWLSHQSKLLARQGSICICFKERNQLSNHSNINNIIIIIIIILLEFYRFYNWTFLLQTFKLTHSKKNVIIFFVFTFFWRPVLPFSVNKARIKFVWSSVVI